MAGQSGWLLIFSCTGENSIRPPKPIMGYQPGSVTLFSRTIVKTCQTPSQTKVIAWMPRS